MTETILSLSARVRPTSPYCRYTVHSYDMLITPYHLSTFSGIMMIILYIHVTHFWWSNKWFTVFALRIWWLLSDVMQQWKMVHCTKHQSVLFVSICIHLPHICIMINKDLEEIFILTWWFLRLRMMITQPNWWYTVSIKKYYTWWMHCSSQYMLKCVWCIFVLFICVLYFHMFFDVLCLLVLDAHVCLQVKLCGVQVNFPMGTVSISLSVCIYLNR